MISGDSVIVARRSGANSRNEILLSAVNSNDLQYTYNNRIDPISFGLQDYPEITGNKDTIGVVWQDNRNSYMDCFFSVSTSGAATVSGSVVLTDTNNLGSKTDPDITYANGTFHFVYTYTGTHEIFYRTATFTSSTTITEIDKNGLTVFPNPANNKIKITTDLTGKIRVKNIEGKVLLQLDKNKESKSIYISHLPSGIYTIELQKLTAKFIKQ